MKLVVLSSAIGLLLSTPAVARAQDTSRSSCPPGSWFCAPPPEQPATPAGKPVQPLQPLPDPDETPTPPTRQAQAEPAAPQSSPPVVVYEPPPPAMVERPEAPPPYEYVPPPRHRAISPPHEWGLNLRLEGAILGSGTEHNASMGGVGAGLRFKPSRYFGIESDLDFVGGHGYAGDVRNEKALSFNGLLFLNPQSHAQVYLLGGFGWSWADSQSDPSDPTVTPANAYHFNYSYFGGQAGVGLELRVSRVVAFDIDLRGFLRSRTDQLAQAQPEFTNGQTGQTTNTSGGGLLTGGMTLYF